MLGLTVLVVDRDPVGRAEVVHALRALGMHAIGAFVPIDAVALLDGIAADVVLVRSDDEDTALAFLRTRTVLVRVNEADPPEAAVAALLDAFGQHQPAATLN
jgi:hypothetical protein